MKSKINQNGACAHAKNITRIGTQRIFVSYKLIIAAKKTSNRWRKFKIWQIKINAKTYL
jgi:hypothetical protein